MQVGDTLVGVDHCQFRTTRVDGTNVRIELDTGEDVTVLRDAVPVLEGEVIDASVMNVKALREFFAREIDAAKSDDLLLSLHLKATRMKVSDPIMFGHAVTVYYKDVFEKHAQT